MIRRVALWGAVCAGVAGLIGASDPSSASRTATAPSKADRSFGTTIQWERTMDAAAMKADRYGKLVMVLAVAGHFEDPFFT